MLSRACRRVALRLGRAGARRHISVLGIETSCDDTSVCLLEQDERAGAPVHVHSHHTARCLRESEKYGGIHPEVAMDSQSRNIAPLVARVLAERPPGTEIGLIAATRGPGMSGSLAQGFNVGKGVALGMGVPFIGVHHMQAHALTPRLLTGGEHPTFPYLSLLLSGGHTMLVLSHSQTQHEILANTMDIAVGDMLDKLSRALGVSWDGKMPAAAMEAWCFPAGSDYTVTARDMAWDVVEPLTVKPKHAGAIFYTFGGLGSGLERLVYEENDVRRRRENLTDDDLRSIGRCGQQLAFQHVLRRAFMAVKRYYKRNPTRPRVSSIVCSGGVARNGLLRKLLYAQAREFDPGMRVVFPPLELCVDNAVMIAWAGLEMYRLGYTTAWDAQRERTWPLPELLSRSGWIKKHDTPEEQNASHA